MMTSPFSCILFDLDGTIADSAPGITSTLTWTLQQMHLPIPTPTELLVWVGPPIMDSFRDLAHLDATQAARALDIYRGHYLEHGALDSEIYPGMAELLARVKASGIPTSLATSKPELPARAILKHFGVIDSLDIITGASDDETRSSKADVVAEALRRLERFGADVSHPVLVGDRIHDVEGAAAHGVPTIFVEWGYGSKSEAAGAIAVAETPAQLGDLLLGVTAAA